MQMPKALRPIGRGNPSSSCHQPVISTQGLEDATQDAKQYKAMPADRSAPGNPAKNKRRIAVTPNSLNKIQNKSGKKDDAIQ